MAPVLRLLLDTLMGFKEDADFARFVSMGAAGAAAVSRHLRDEYGHRPVELERYAMANKVWQTKPKRMRLPDLVCLRCGRRVEARAKSKLGIIVSDAATAGRAWNAGMRPNDLYAFARADTSEIPPRVSRPIYFTAEALERTYEFATRFAPKAASAGYETMIEWKTWVPTWSGIYVEVDDEGNIVCMNEVGHRRTYKHWLDWERRCLYLAPEDTFDAGEQIVAGIVEPTTDLACPGDIWDVARALETTGERAAEEGEDTVERYVAVKAIGILGRHDLQPSLEGVLDGENWRLDLEALVSLARLDPSTWAHQIIERVEALAGSDEEVVRSGARMESILALSEVSHEDAAVALASVANDRKYSSELRAAAAWGLGRGAYPQPELLLPLTLDDDKVVSLHAIVGMSILPDELVPKVVAWLASPDDKVAATARTVLVRHQAVRPLLGAVAGGGAAGLWALSALGDLPPEAVRDAGGDDLDAATVDRLKPLWLGQRDWLQEDEGRDGLEALDVQTVRFDPTIPC